MSKIIAALKSGGAYWCVKFQDVKTGSVYNAYLHESEYNLRVFEEKHLGKKVTQAFLDEYKDLINDVERYNRRMEEFD